MRKLQKMDILTKARLLDELMNDATEEQLETVCEKIPFIEDLDFYDFSNQMT